MSSDHFDNPGELDRSSRRRLTRPALRSFFGIARAWGLTTDEQLSLLGLESRSTLNRWRRGEVHTLTRDALERISYVVGIYRAINILLPFPERAHRWVRSPNSVALFGGRSALERMLSGHVGDLYVVRRYLDSQIAGY